MNLSKFERFSATPAALVNRLRVGQGEHDRALPACTLVGSR